MNAEFTLGCQKRVLDMAQLNTSAIFLPDTQLWADVRPACITQNGELDSWHHGDIRWHEAPTKDGCVDLIGRDYVTYCWDAHLRRLLMVLELMGGAEDPILAEEGSKLRLEGVLPCPSVGGGDIPHTYLAQKPEANVALNPEGAQTCQHQRRPTGGSGSEFPSQTNPS